MTEPVRSMRMDIVEHSALDGQRYRVTIAANEKVRQPPELDFEGLSTENYTKNPVVMWAHDAVGRSPSGGLPIGRTTDLKKTSDGRLVTDFEFLGDDPFALRVKNAWDKGFLQAASISWIPVESVPVEGTWRDTKSDLLEWSLVSVPADPEALRKSHGRLMDAFLHESGDHEAAVVGDHRQRHQPAEAMHGLSLDAYEDVVTAVGLLRRAVEGAPHREAIREAADGPSDDISAGDALEIREMVDSIKSAVNGRETSTGNPSEDRHS